MVRTRIALYAGVGKITIYIGSYEEISGIEEKILSSV